jgi:upstream activation factor subunit UAF30
MSTTDSQDGPETEDKKSDQPEPAARRSRSALTKPVRPDEYLAAVLGVDELPRPEVARRLWDYIKAEGLQDKNNRRMINADDKLRPIFEGRDQVDMFEMNKLVSKHMS